MNAVIDFRPYSEDVLALLEEHMPGWHTAIAAERARRMAVRRSVLEATLVSMPDKLEELYQLVMASPYAKDMGSKIEDSLSRLRIAEEVAAEFDDSELDAIESPLTRGDSRTKANATLGQISRQQAARRVGAIKQ